MYVYVRSSNYAYIHFFFIDFFLHCVSLFLFLFIIIIFTYFFVGGVIPLLELPEVPFLISGNHRASNPDGHPAPTSKSHADSPMVPLDPQSHAPPPLCLIHPLSHSDSHPLGAHPQPQPNPPCVPDLPDIQLSQEDLMTFIRHRFGAEGEALLPALAVIRPPGLHSLPLQIKLSGRGTQI